MATAAERRALFFLATVAVVGGGMRAVGARRFATDVRIATGQLRADSSNPTSRALADQIAAVDSARASGGRRGARRRRSSDSADGVRPSRRRTLGRDVSSDAAGTDPARAPTITSRARDSVRDPSTVTPIDVNAASTQELERLPRIGPALAKRMIAWRDSHGAFTSEEDLRHVPGIGPVTVKLLVPLVTFSSGYRPLHSATRSAHNAPPL